MVLKALKFRQVDGLHRTLGEIVFSKRFSMKRLSFVVGNELYETWGVSRGFQGECMSLAGAEVPGTLHLIKVLTGHVLIGREEVKPVIWPPSYLTTSSVVVVGVTRLQV